MKVCIFGAGAIGGYLAAGLSNVEGVELSLVARGPLDTGCRAAIKYADRPGSP